MYDITFPICKRTGSEKTIKAVIQPDERIIRYNVSLEEVQTCFLQGEATLSPFVPNEIRERLAVARDLATYGYFQWEFFTVSLFWSLTVIEMALRYKFNEVNKALQGPNHFKKGFRALMNWAVNKQLISPDIPIYSQVIRKVLSNKSSQATNADILVEGIPNLRNEFAHPTWYNIMAIPRDAIEGYRQAIEIINNLWDKSSS